MIEYQIDAEPEPELEPTPPPVIAPPTEPVPPQDPNAPIIDQAGRLVSHANCRGCGYDLHGLLVNGDCPECHTSVEWTLRGNLQFADATWLAQVARGLLMLIIAIFAGIGVGGGVVVVSVAFAFSTVTGGLVAAIGFGVLLVLIGAIAVVQAWAYLMITTLEPNSPSGSGNIRWRAVARVTLPTAVGLGFIAAFMSPDMLVLIDPDAWGWDTLAIASGGLTIVSTIINLIGLFALCTYAAGIAVRIPSPSLARQTKVVMWVLIATTALGVPLTYLLADPLWISGPPPLILLVFGLYSLVGLVFWIWGIVLLFRYRNSLQRALAQAKRGQMGIGQK